MAFLNIPIKATNITPVNDEYIFNLQFVTSDGYLIVDNRLPQNQTFTFTQLTNPLIIEASVSDGVYSIPNVIAKIIHGTKSWTKNIGTVSINCQGSCSVNINTIVQTNNTSYTVTFNTPSIQTYNYNIYSGTNLIKTGVINSTTNVVNITTPVLANGTYLLELIGQTCLGKITKAFVVSNTINACQTGPTLLNITNPTPTQLTFGFNGVSVFSIKWRIKSGTLIIRNGITYYIGNAPIGEQTYSNSTPIITFASLNAGSYTLEIEGNSCTSSTTSSTFTVVDNIPFAFTTGAPSVTNNAGVYSINIAVNKSGSYLTTVLNSTTGVYYKNETVAFDSNISITVSNVPVGQYIIKVDTLSSNLIIQNSGGGACTSGPTLTSILSPTINGVGFQFDGVNVASIAWRVRSSGTVVRNGIVFPTNSTPYVTFDTPLTNGTYTLEIEGSSCSSVSSGPISFTTAPVVIGGNGGLFSKVVGNKTYSWVHGNVLTGNVNETTGGVVLTYPDIQNALAGSNSTKAILLNKHMAQIKSSEVIEFRSSNGKQLPDGIHDYYVYYFNPNIATTLEEIIANYWVLGGQPGVAITNYARPQKISIEVRTN